MNIGDFKKTKAQRTAERRAGHEARIKTRWADHVPPFEKWVDSTRENQYQSTIDSTTRES